jgi:hypothetical protein
MNNLHNNKNKKFNELLWQIAPAIMLYTLLALYLGSVK